MTGRQGMEPELPKAIMPLMERFCTDWDPSY